MKNNHEIILKQYAAYCKEQPLYLGTAGSYGMEMLTIIREGVWAEYDILAVFHPPVGAAVQVRVGANNQIGVPIEATAEKGMGEIVFAGYKEGVRQIAVDVLYKVAPSSGASGTEPAEPTPDVVQQIMLAANAAEKLAQSVRDDADAGKFNGVQGDPGKDAVIDTTLSHAGEAADAAEVGKLKENFVNLKEYVKGTNFPETWEQVVLAIKSKLHKEMYAVGDKFGNIWKDTNNYNKEYDNPLRINHFEDGLELEDGTTVNGMWLQTVYAHLKDVQFSHQQAFYVSNEGMTAGTYCIGFDDTWGTNGYVNKGDYWNFTLTKDVPAGAKLTGFYEAPDQPQTNWRVYVYSADGKTVLETVSTVNKGQKGTLLGVMSAYGNDTLNGIQQVAYGDNRYATSAIRQYLNSDKPKGEWWTAQAKWDIAPDQLNQIDGYLCGMDPELLAVLQPVKVVTYCNTVTAIGQKQVKDITYDKVTMISLEQMYIKSQIAGEGEAHEYYKELNGTDTKFQLWQTYEILKAFAVGNPTISKSICLRSVYLDSAYDIWHVLFNGFITNSNAAGTNVPIPLMFIGAASSNTISAPTDTEERSE